ncbi:MAG: ROK family protein [Dongiaceae bacterium]
MNRLANGQGSNSAALRRHNERVILTALRRLGEASKADLARRAGLTHNATGQIVHELEQQRLICTVGKRMGARGQPATLLRLDPGGIHSIGLKIGRRSIDALLVDFGGNAIEIRRQERAFPLPQEALAIALAEIKALRAAVPRSSRGALAGVGLAMPYNLGNWRRELGITSDAYAAWNDFDIAEELRKATGLPVFVENDGTAAAMAELFQGHGREFNDFVSIFIGTATGGGVVLDGDYRRGITGNAGDIGLIPVSPSRLPSARKHSRPFEVLLARASIGALLRHFENNVVVAKSRAELDLAIESHPDLVDEWLADCADSLVVPVLAIGCVLDLECIVIDGDLPRDVITRLVDRLRGLLQSTVPEARQPPSVLVGAVGRNAASVGAAILPLHLNYSPNRQLLFA